MTTNQKEKINWTPIAIGGAALGGLFLIWKIMQTVEGGSEADRELAREILDDWQQEFDLFKPYSESIYYGGRQPTDQELAILSSILDQMSLKEQTIYNLSRTVWNEMRELLDAAASNWWLIPVVGFSWVPPYAGYKIWRRWHDHRNPPPNFPCPRCDAAPFTTEGALKHHVDTTHPVSAKYAIDAQVEFAKTATAVQNAIAVESFYARTYTNWSSWSLGDLEIINWSIISAGVAGIASVYQTSILWQMVFMLTPFP